MILYIVIGLFIFLLLIRFFSRKELNEVNSSKKQLEKIEDCISKEDMQFQISSEKKRVLSVVEENKSNIEKAMKAAHCRVSEQKLKSYERTLEISTNLEKNLRYYQEKNLKNSKFHYYTNLHFRSMKAADIMYKEYKEIELTFNKINKLKYVKGLSDEQLKSTKKTLFLLKNALIKQVHSLNHKTENIKR